MICVARYSAMPAPCPPQPYSPECVEKGFRDRLCTPITTPTRHRTAREHPDTTASKNRPDTLYLSKILPTTTRNREQGDTRVFSLTRRRSLVRTRHRPLRIPRRNADCYKLLAAHSDRRSCVSSGVIRSWCYRPAPRPLGRQLGFLGSVGGPQDPRREDAHRGTLLSRRRPMEVPVLIVAIRRSSARDGGGTTSF